ARLHEAGEAVRDRHGETCPDDAPLARRQRRLLARGEIEAGVARVGGLRQNGVVVQTPDRKLDQRAPATGVSTAAAPRYGAKRRSCARGRRARMKTPSGRSIRSSIGAPSA